jgi:two-component system KDP operon response regulator KdpE
MVEAKPKTGRILVVDDDPEMTDMLVTVLSDAGYGTAAAPGGAEALESVRRDPPDVVITDLSMPEMDGLELVEALRGLDPRPAFIVLTAFGDWPSFCRAQDLGVDKYLTKPVALAELLEDVRALLDAARGPSGAGGPESEPKEDPSC